MNFGDLKNSDKISSFFARPLAGFLFAFIGLYLAFYFLNLAYIGLSAPGGYYVVFLDEHLNYVRGLRNLLLSASAGVLNLFGYHTKTSAYELLVVGHGKIIVVYSCLGLGIMSFFAAFALAWPAPWRIRIGFLIGGLIFIQLLNILRFVLLSLFWNSASGVIPVDHHLVYNAIVYLVLVGIVYLYINHPKIKRYAYR